MVFDEASGLAYQLDTLRATTLLLLEEAPAESSELMEKVDGELQTGDPVRLATLLDMVLAELEDVRLISCAAVAHEVA